MSPEFWTTIVLVLAVLGLIGSILLGWFWGNRRDKKRIEEEKQAVFLLAASKMHRDLEKSIEKKNQELKDMSAELTRERAKVANELLSLEQRRKELLLEVQSADITKLKRIIEEGFE